MYTSSNPAAFSAYGDVGLVVGRLQGKTMKVPKRLLPATCVNSANTIIGDRLRRNAELDNDGWPIDSSYNEIVLRTSSQCLPLIKYGVGLVKRRHGQECLASLEQSLGLILKELFNDVTPQQYDRNGNSSPLGFSSRTNPPSITSTYSPFGAPALPSNNSTSSSMPQNHSSAFQPFQFSNNTQAFNPHSAFFASPPPRPPIFSGVHSSLPFNNGAQPDTGTLATHYQQTVKQDGSNKVTIASITAMPEYETKSFEELRIADYRLGNFGARPSISSALQECAQTTTGKSNFHIIFSIRIAIPNVHVFTTHFTQPVEMIMR